MKSQDKTKLDESEYRITLSYNEEREKKSNKRLVCPVVKFTDLRIAMGLAYSSRALDSIKVHRGEIVDGKVVEYDIRVLNRPYIHLFVQAEKSGFKSAHARALKEQFPDTVMSQDYVTGAGLRGSITDEGKFVTPLLFNMAQKCVIMDEVIRDRHGETTRMNLQMFEGNHYTYKLGRKTDNIDSRNLTLTLEDGRMVSGMELYQKTGAFYSVHDSNVEIFAPFTAIWLSMYPLSFMMSSELGKALLDRMLVVTYDVTDEDRHDVEVGKYEFKFPIYSPDREVEISVEEFIKIVEIRDKKMKPGKLVSPTRILDNMIRAYATVKNTLTLDSKELDYLFDLITRVSGAFWMEVAPPRRHN